jgi:hypothetical protein
VATNQHAEILRVVYILSLININDLNTTFADWSSVDIFFHVLWTASIKLTIGAFFGLVAGFLVSLWTKKIVRDSQNLIQLILGSYFILYALFKLFSNIGSRFASLVTFTLTIKIVGFSKYKFDSSVFLQQIPRISSKS